MATTEIPWDTLVERIEDGKLTPFLGAGISYPTLPTASELAELLAASYKPRYPFRPPVDLMQISQFMATMEDGYVPKARVRDIFQKTAPPDFKDPAQPHAILAMLPIPIYLTTNYDDYMEEALRNQIRTPIVEVCRWNSSLQDRPSHLAENEATKGNPVVFHLHGHISDPDSFVLTEDDYLDFMVNVRRFESGGDPSSLTLPLKVNELIKNTSLLFLGYGLRDWNLRVILRALVEAADGSSRKMGVSVQVEPDDEKLIDDAGKDAAIEYLEKYFQPLKLSVFWGDAGKFLTTLKGHWDDHIRDKHPEQPAAPTAP